MKKLRNLNAYWNGGSETLSLLCLLFFDHYAYYCLHCHSFAREDLQFTSHSVCSFVLDVKDSSDGSLVAHDDLAVPTCEALGRWPCFFQGY